MSAHNNNDNSNNNGATPRDGRLPVSTRDLETAQSAEVIVATQLDVLARE